MPQTIYDHRSKGNLSTDPVRNFKFIVDIGHPSFQGMNNAELRFGFMGVSGLNVNIEEIPYREGGNNVTPRKMPGQANYSNLTFTQGVILGRFAGWDWFQDIFDVVQGRPLGGGSNREADFRVDMYIHVLAHPSGRRGANQANSLLSFKVFNAWPTSIAFSDLDAGGNAVVVNQMVLAHEGWVPLLAADYNDDQVSRIAQIA